MPIELLPETPSQTAGPYVHIGLALAAAGNPARDQEIWSEMAKPGAPGEHILLIGHVYDGNGHLIRDSFLELWQANHEACMTLPSIWKSPSMASDARQPPSMLASGRCRPSSPVW